MAGLDHVYNVDIIIHLVRCFDHLQQAHYHEDYNPLRDLIEVEQELMLKVRYTLLSPLAHSSML